MTYGGIAWKEANEMLLVDYERLVFGYIIWVSILVISRAYLNKKLENICMSRFILGC